MKATERRQAIFEILCERRHEKIENLAFQFNVSERTIRNDVLELSLSYPVYTVAGRYNGGVYLDDDYYFGKQYLSNEQQKLLESLLSKCNSDEQKTMQSIIKRFGRKR